MYPRYRDDGFTLIELIVAVAVLGIVAAIAAPSFSSLIADNQTATETNQLISTMQLARSEAVRRGEDVTVTAKSNDFSNGWCVHTGADCATDARKIRDFGAQSSNFSSADNFITFSRRGERTNQGAANPFIEVKPTNCTSGDVDRQNKITIGVSGRVSLDKENC